GREIPRARPAPATAQRAHRRGGLEGARRRALRTGRDHAAAKRRRSRADPLPTRGGWGMSELRFNELRDEEVVYAVHRQDRTFLPTRDHCPLCPTRPGSPETEIPLPAFE